MGLADFTNSIVTKDGFSNTFKKFDNSVQGSARGLDKLGGVISGGGLGMLFGGTAVIAGAAAIGKATWELAELGAQSLTTKASFETLMQSVGQSSGLLDQLKTAAGGTVTEMGLMQQANVALAGASGQLATEMAAALPQLLEAGRAAAMLNPAMGDAAFMFQSLVTGIKRGSPMLIDNTGITLKLGEATEAYAASIGKGVTELTAQERSIAILRATLESSGTLIEQVGGNLNTMTSDLQRSKVAVEELKTAFAELTAPTVATGAGNLANALGDILAWFKKDEVAQAEGEIRRLTEQLEWLNNLDLSKAKTGQDRAWQIDQIRQVRQELGKLTQEYISADMTTKAAAWSARDAAGAYGEAAAASRTAGIDASALAATLQGLRNAYSIATGAASQYAAVLGGNITSRAFIGGADVLSQSQYTNLTQSRINLERGLQVQVLAGIKTQMEADYALAQYDNTVNDHISSLRTQSTAVASTGAAYDDLKSKISGALRPTFDLSGLTGGALGGVGGDAFDEAYKRLAAVALRPEELQIHAGDWASTFEQAGLTGLTPEDAQARAKELVEAYSKGLDFSLIDREAIKDSVRQAIRAEELYNTIVDEIYAEMGKEKPKLAQAGASVGNQLNRAMTATVTSGASAYLGAWLDVLEPGMIARLDARYRRTGQMQ